MDTNLRVLLVDPAGIVRAGLTALIRTAHPEVVVTEAETEHEALAAAKRSPWDLFVVEPGLAESDGIELVRKLRRLHPHTPIVAFSSASEKHQGGSAVRAGASCFLSKSAPCAAIIAMLSSLTSGDDSNAYDLLCASHASCARPDGYAALSETERMVLREIGRGQAVKEIARTRGISASTVGTHRARILKKLRLQTTAELVRYVIEHHLH